MLHCLQGVEYMIDRRSTPPAAGNLALMLTGVQAVNLFASIHVPLNPRTYPSGVTIIQSAAHSDAEVSCKWLLTSDLFAWPAAQ